MKDFLFTLLAWLLTLPFIVGAVAFALYNQTSMPVTLNPFTGPADMPLYAPVLGAVALGFLFGMIMTWAAMGRLRKEKREQNKRIKTLEKQIQSAVATSATPSQNYSLIASGYTERTGL